MHMSVESSAVHDPIVGRIRTLLGGMAAKPSRRELGGDCAVALFPDLEAEHAFIAAVTERGRAVIPVNAGPAGLLG